MGIELLGIFEEEGANRQKARRLILTFFFFIKSVAAQLKIGGSPGLL